MICMAFQLTVIYIQKTLCPNNISWANILVLIFSCLCFAYHNSYQSQKFMINCPCWKPELTAFKYFIILLPSHKTLKYLFSFNFFIKNILNTSSAVTLCKIFSGDLAMYTPVRYFLPVSFHPIKKTIYRKKLQPLTEGSQTPSYLVSAFQLLK